MPPDPELFARMSEPHPDRKAAEEALAAFDVGLKYLREKLRICTIVVTATANFTEADEVTDIALHRTFGDSRDWLPLASLAVAKEQKRIRQWAESVAKAEAERLASE